MSKPTLLERLDSKTRKTDYCWEWLASKNAQGYGCISVNGRPKRAHRAYYELLVGEIPK